MNSGIIEVKSRIVFEKNSKEGGVMGQEAPEEQCFIYVDDQTKKPCLVKVGKRISATVYNTTGGPEENLYTLAENLKAAGYHNIIYDKPDPEILHAIPNNFGRSLYLLP
jgi:hypothetical protein